MVKSRIQKIQTIDKSRKEQTTLIQTCVNVERFHILQLLVAKENNTSEYCGLV